ncbi:MAG: hypothetical protein ACYC61_29130, partial [Isosphaeraceae bacterium]
MSIYYLGYVEFIHPELWGRIRPLATLKKRTSDSNWVVDRRCVPGELGSSGKVFWPKIPYDQDRLQGCYVRFRVEPNQKHRDSDREFDEYVVAEEWRNGNVRRVDQIGWVILSEDLVTGAERVVNPGGRLRAETIVYRRRMRDTEIDGPWRLVEQSEPARLCLQPKDEGHVWKYSLARLPQETFWLWDDGDMRRAVLLAEPPKSAGQVIDHLSDPELADWLIRVLKRDKPLLAHLDQTSPDWRSRIGELLADVADPARRDLEQRRYGRLKAALEELAGNEARMADL